MNIHSVYVIGLGGTGSNLVEPLVRLLSYHEKAKGCEVTFLDGDVYESSNSQRQSFAKELLEQNKARGKAREVTQRTGYLIRSIPEYADRRTLISLIKRNPPTPNSVTLILGCVDNDRSRFEALKAMDALKDLNILLITPGNGLDKGQVLSWGYINSQSTGVDIREFYPQLVKPTDRIPTNDPTSCLNAVESTPQLISANFGAAFWTLSNIQCLLDHNGFWGEIHFDVYGAKASCDNPIDLGKYLTNPQIQEELIPVTL